MSLAVNLDLLVISDEIASGIYEIRELLDHIGTLREGFKYDVVINRSITKEKLNLTKCILFFRSRSILDYKLAVLCKQLNKTLYLFLDDDFLGLKDNYGVNGAGLWEGRKDALRKMLPLMDVIISPNDLLCEKYAQLGKITRKVRIDTSVAEDTLIRSKFHNRNKIVLYINDGSTDTFDKYIRPVLKKLGELKPNVFQVSLLALSPKCNDILGVNINFVSHMTYPEFRNFMNTSDFYIGLAPLDEEGFNKYKYFNKYIEYTRAGILGIYSNCSLYRQVIKNHVNGILVNNTADEWAEAILFCYDHPKEYLGLLENAQSMIVGQFNKDSICNRLIEDLPELFTPNKSRWASNRDIYKLKVMHYCARARERLYLFFRYLKVGGIKGIIAALKHRRERNRECSR